MMPRSIAECSTNPERLAGRTSPGATLGRQDRRTAQVEWNTAGTEPKREIRLSPSHFTLRGLTTADLVATSGEQISLCKTPSVSLARPRFDLWVTQP